jgi:hypothetical protein
LIIDVNLVERRFQLNSVALRIRPGANVSVFQFFSFFCLFKIRQFFMLSGVVMDTKVARQPIHGRHPLVGRSSTSPILFHPFRFG